MAPTTEVSVGIAAEEEVAAATVALQHMVSSNLRQQTNLKVKTNLSSPREPAIGIDDLATKASSVRLIVLVTRPL